ncbi:MAG: pseudaminic acid cytidylyltransferase [Alphaproteobacteria bacterium]|nr:pseudaminic acid cytidylyltransferase [Alphaproteobacteria bacterium]
MRVAIIPARGGSKRIPRKNIKPFCGKPMIAWSIDTAKATGLFDHIIVSTDDDEIADIASQYGAEVPFRRPAELADDYTTTISVIQHAIGQVEKCFRFPEFVCCIYPTAPLMSPEHLQAAYSRLMDENVEYVFPIVSFPSSIFRALKLDEHGRASMFNEANRSSRTQDMEEAYYDAGQFYWGKASAFIAGHPIFSPQSAPLIIPRYYAQDIDNQEDWEYAELIFKSLIK